MTNKQHLKLLTEEVNIPNKIIEYFNWDLELTFWNKKSFLKLLQLFNIWKSTKISPKDISDIYNNKIIEKTKIDLWNTFLNEYLDEIEILIEFLEWWSVSINGNINCFNDSIFKIIWTKNVIVERFILAEKIVDFVSDLKLKIKEVLEKKLYIEKKEEFTEWSNDIKQVNGDIQTNSKDAEIVTDTSWYWQNYLEKPIADMVDIKEKINHENILLKIKLLSKKEQIVFFTHFCEYLLSVQKYFDITKFKDWKERSFQNILHKFCWNNWSQSFYWLFNNKNSKWKIWNKILRHFLSNASKDENVLIFILELLGY